MMNRTKRRRLSWSFAECSSLVVSGSARQSSWKAIGVSLLLFSTLFGTQTATGDLALYHIRGTRAVLVLPEGKARVLPGRVLTFQIAGMGRLVLSAETTQLIKAPLREERFKKTLAKARIAKDAEGCLEAGRFALKSGLLPGFYEAAVEAWNIDKTHPCLKRIAAARKAVRKPVEDQEKSVARIRELVDQNDMRVEVSDHYVMLHDLSDDLVDRKGIPRAKKRLELLETVYESYFLKFALENCTLEPPKERMMVLLFGEEENYLHYATLLDPDLKNALGFWSQKSNLAVFFDQGTSERHQSLKELNTRIQRDKELAIKRRGPGTRDIVHLANSLGMIIDISREQDDIKVVSHEATHQLAGNTGLLPRGEVSLLWAHEGLATYFETPNGNGWGGIGAVNRDRLNWYRILSSDQEHSNIRFIVSDSVFDFASSNAETVAAYGQAWALTHFLMETRFSKLVDYYAAISKIETAEDGKILRAAIVETFEETFGDIGNLESEWRRYMRELETDRERLLHGG